MSERYFEEYMAKTNRIHLENVPMHNEGVNFHLFNFYLYWKTFSYKTGINLN